MRSLDTENGSEKVRIIQSENNECGAGRLSWPVGTGPRRQGLCCTVGQESLSGEFLKFLRAISPHTLRHSFGSNLVQAGVDLYTVCTLMGHSSVAMTQR